MDNSREAHRETLLDELNDFERKRPNEIPAILEDYLSVVAKTGDTIFPWSKLKPLLYKKLEMVMSEFYESFPTDNLPTLPNVEAFKYETMKDKILEAVDCFHSAPFTIQRLCELVVNPRKHYKRTDKFMRGLEKNILVVSTVEPHSPYHQEGSLVNGVIDSAPSSTSDSKEAEEKCPSVVTSINGSSPSPCSPFTSLHPSLQNRLDSKGDENNEHELQDSSLDDSPAAKRLKEDPDPDATQETTAPLVEVESTATETVVIEEAKPEQDAETIEQPVESEVELPTVVDQYIEEEKEEKIETLTSCTDESSDSASIEESAENVQEPEHEPIVEEIEEAPEKIKNENEAAFSIEVSETPLEEAVTTPEVPKEERKEEEKEGEEEEDDEAESTEQLPTSSTEDSTPTSSPPPAESKIEDSEESPSSKSEEPMEQD